MTNMCLCRGFNILLSGLLGIFPNVLINTFVLFLITSCYVYSNDISRICKRSVIMSRYWFVWVGRIVNFFSGRDRLFKLCLTNATSLAIDWLDS